MEALRQLLDALPALNKDRDPQLAAVLGFLFGGLGLGIYFLSFIDFLIPVGIVIAISVVFTNVAQLDPFVGLLAGGIIAALYGYLRADTSNRKRAAAPASR